MTDHELMQWALDALDGYARNCRCEGGGGTTDAAEALRNRLEKWTARDMAYRPGGLSQSEREPVAWMVVSAEGKIEETSHYKPAAERWLKYVATRRLVPLYTTPKIHCGCGDQIMPDDGAECGNCVAARNAVKPDLAQVGEVGIWGK